MLKRLDIIICVLTDKTGSEETSDEDHTSVMIGDQKPTKITTSSPFLDQDQQPVSFSDASKWDHSDNWDAIICPDILVSRKELLQLLAEKLHTPRNRMGMKKVARCIHSINRHVTVTTVSKMRLHYWSSGTYNCVGRKSSAWQTWVEVEGYDRTHLEVVIKRLGIFCIRLDMIIYVLTECACVSLFLTHLFNILTDKTGSEETSDEHNTPAVIGDQKPTKITTSSPFLDQDNKPVSISDTRKWTHSDNWDAIICADILVSRKELLQLLGEKLHISRNQDGMRKVVRAMCLLY